jgi:hypothetical protein
LSDDGDEEDEDATGDEDEFDDEWLSCGGVASLFSLFGVSMPKEEK